jgi:Cu-Zn family superoxide dismutase
MLAAIGVPPRLGRSSVRDVHASSDMDLPKMLAFCTCAALLVGCERDGGEAPAHESFAADAAPAGEIAIDPGAKRRDPVQRAVAVLHGTDLGPGVRGIVQFEANGPEQVRVVADVEGLAPGEHAYHLHVFGDCSSPDGESAGTHFNLRGSSMNPPEDIARITGDLGVLVADESGRAHAESVIEGVTMQGGYTILGRSVIVHEKGNDHSQPPMGAAGGRVACGVVGVAETKA